MAVVFKAMLVAAALLLVGFGAAGEAWARFTFPPNQWRKAGATTSYESIITLPRQAFTDHIWVNSKLAQAPRYVDTWKGRSKFEVLQVATAARDLHLAEEVRASAAKKAAAISKAGPSKGVRPRFMFQPSICRFGASDRPSASYVPSPSVSRIRAANLDALPSSATLLLKPRTGH